MTGRRWAVLLAVVTTLALAGCTGGGSTAPTDSPTATTPAPVATATPAATSTATPSGAATPTATPGGAVTATPTAEAGASQIRAAALATARTVSAYEATVDGTFLVSSNNVEQTITIDNSLAVDRDATAYERHLTQSARGRTTTIQGYLLDGTNYVESPRNVRRYDAAWIEANVSSNATALLDRYDVLGTYRQALGNASVSVAGATTGDGTTLRILHAEPDVSTLDRIFHTGNRTTVTDASLTYWIDREGAIRRVNATIEQTTETQFTTTNRTVDVSLSFTYGTARIDLPDAARSAVDVTDERGGGTGTDEDGTGTEPGDEGTDTDDDETETNATDGIAVREGDLAVDPDRTFRYVEDILATNVTDPDAVVVQGPANRTRDGEGTDRRTLSSILGLESTSLSGTNVTLGDHDVPLAWLAEGRVDGVGNVYLHSASAMPDDVSRLLAAHEFVHYVQLQNGRFNAVNAGTDPTTDGSYAARATTEGAAVFATDALLSQYAPDGPRNTELYAEIAAAAPAGSASVWRNSWYVYGDRYVADRIDDPAGLSALYETPPTTSEQVLHRLAPGSEPPVPLGVRVATGDDYVAVGTDRKGEAYLRYVLENGVGTDRASAAAAGWGNDTLRSIRPADGEGTTGYVWVHRWDSPAEATEFAAAARDYLDSYGTVENGTTTLKGVPARFETLGERTTALVIGSNAFQNAVTVRLDGVTVVAEMT